MGDEMTLKEQNRKDFKRVISPGLTKEGRLFVTIQYKDGRLSFFGVVGPLANGEAKGSCGQCLDELANLEKLSEGWTPELANRLAYLWERWHLNDMRAGCEHQRQLNTHEKVEIVRYILTTEAYRLREATQGRLAESAALGTLAVMSDTERALVLLRNWYEDIYTPPDADSPLSGCYKVHARETKTVGMTYPKEHPKGILGVACPECGYKYGSARLFEAVPDSVLDELCALPAAEKELPGAWQR